MQHSKQEREYSLTVFGKCNVDYYVKDNWHLTTHI